MSEPPTGTEIQCPECDAKTTAIIPVDSVIVADEADADGKVWVDCLECGGRFKVYFRTGEG